MLLCLLKRAVAHKTCLKTECMDQTLGRLPYQPGAGKKVQKSQVSFESRKKSLTREKIRETNKPGME